jgi:hypothetical protein
MCYFCNRLVVFKLFSKNGNKGNKIEPEYFNSPESLQFKAQ